ncbi:polysaccharide deacetylase family protein [Thauera sp.]|jgi:peptidoglycan/xylan/chitin deacetylase (PgdA/CDA1 family)|uniref:polysaccharide deacetylase family protein n=1 Tax=Thauera sp. TaxID=1905334 RepID=UPI002634F596|nr:polysaccharide deacetylase family protein [Thauera sp.]MCK6408208.1 polysaccharide deacetylase family protein [Thauera sp.]
MTLGLVLGALAVAAWFSNRYAWWRSPVDWQRPRVLMYHMVSPHRPGARFNGLRVTPEHFEAQLAWLQREGWRFFTLSELWQQWDTLPPKSVAITFDDGYADNLHNALPLLEKYDARATIYLVVDRHERDWSTAKKAHHDSGELAREPKLSDDELQRLVASGRIEIGSHTLSHINLRTTSAADKRHELAESRRLLQAQSGQPVASFAYPFGIYADEDVALTRAAGYTTAVTTIDGIDTRTPRPDPLQLKRIKVSGKDNMLAFAMRMRGGKRGWRK